LLVSHVLRYTQHFIKMRQIIQSGRLGQLINVDHRENVSWWHMSHSYVRGNWRRRDESAPMILAKCCHDLDILTWMLNRTCVRLSSVGGLLHYRKENAPVGAAKRCMDGCQVFDSCPYYAPFIYLELAPLWRTLADTGSGMVRWAARRREKSPWLIQALSPFIPALREISPYRGWPLTVLTPDPTRENVMQALQEGPYGRCVYYCDNDVVDNQVVNMEFEGGISVTLTMQGHSHIEHRTTKIEGSRATLTADFGTGGSWIEVNEHLSDDRIRYDTSAGAAGHGGGDAALMDAFLHSLTSGEDNPSLTTARQSIESHLMAFAADEARLKGTVIDMQEYRSRE
jgi:predicted dehydrogenase